MQSPRRIVFWDSQLLRVEALRTTDHLAFRFANIRAAVLSLSAGTPGTWTNADHEQGGEEACHGWGKGSGFLADEPHEPNAVEDSFLAEELKDSVKVRFLAKESEELKESVNERGSFLEVEVEDFAECRPGAAALECWNCFGDGIDLKCLSFEKESDSRSS